MTCSDPNVSVARAEQLNRDCRCFALDRQKLQTHLSEQTNGETLYRMIIEDRPHLVSDSVAFIAKSNLEQQLEIVAAVERVLAMPAYQKRVLSHAPQTAQFEPKAKGVFLGYDFHLTETGPRLIEINSNAGGALLNVLLARALTACDSCACEFPTVTKAESAEQAIIDMFRQEWQLESHQQPLKTIAIVDTKPLEQYMLPEFMLFQNLFTQNGIDAIICDPSELVFRNGGLYFNETAIDLVYNRLTDFALQEPQQQALLDAYLAHAVVVTPHPRNHATYADKRNLALLTNPDTLVDMGVDAKTRAILLQGIARTELINEQNAESFWQQRKQLFFKPAKGYGSKAAYRGDKLTHRVFAEILQSDYVAQTLAQPSLRQVTVDGQNIELKMDVRHFVYQGQTQWLCARLYQGQTTNFRTPGGGFAQVVIV